MAGAYSDASPEERLEYETQLRVGASISAMFSDSDKPYLGSRLVENAFCDSFGAVNVSRSDVGIDAYIGSSGYGIKTFVDSRTQKIAEFDRDRAYMETGSAEEDARHVAELRNRRIEICRELYGVTDFFYHCVVRSAGQISVVESAMEEIDIQNIAVTQSKSTGFSFTDGRHRYNYNRSKSTLSMRFDLDDPVRTFDVKMFDDPLKILRRVFNDEMNVDPRENAIGTLVLPLFSMRSSGEYYIPLKSGLNQWNAGGRRRSPDEVYIPFNKEYRSRHADFFPERDTPFRLTLAGAGTVTAKVCQDYGKAIMSNPNSDLGVWILRDVLHLRPGELATMEKLEEAGVDAVVFTKYANGTYSANVSKIRY